MSHLLPYALFYLPVVVAMFVSTSYRARGRLLMRAPLSPFSSYLSSVLTGLAASILSIITAFLPAFMVCLAKNGLGDFSYPVLYQLGSSFVESSLGESLAQSLVLFISTSLFFTCLIEAIFALTSAPILGSALAAVLIALPMFSVYVPIAQSIIGAFLPSTYLITWSVGGYASYVPCLDTCSIAGISFLAGVVSCCAGAIALFVVSLLMREIIDRPREVRWYV